MELDDRKAGELLNVKQAAARLGVSPALIYELIQLRKIRHERHGLGRGTIRISESALDEYRRSREVAPEDRVARPERRRKLDHIRLK